MRSLLFVPGDDERKLAKALASGADALIVDLEDSVAAAAKAAARATAAAFLAEARGRAKRPRLYVRVNALDSGLAEADLDAIMAGAPDGIVLPKCRDGADVQRLAAKLAVREAECGLVDGATRILAIATESARALFGFASYRGASARLAGLSWGAEDLSADLGAETNRLPGGAYAAPYAFARTLTLIGAVAAEVAPIDAVFTNFRDAEGLPPRRRPRAATALSPRWRSIRRKFPSSTRSSRPRPRRSPKPAPSSPRSPPRPAPASSRSKAKCSTCRI